MANTEIVQGHIVPAYRRLATTVQSLDEVAGAYCTAPSEEGGEALRTAYLSATDSWMGVQHLHLGPAELFMRRYRFYFWPEGRGHVGPDVEEALAADAADPFAAEKVANASVSAQGLPAVSYLLFGDNSLFARGEDDPRYCRLLQAITANLSTMADELVRDWTKPPVNFEETIAAPGPENAYYETHRDVTLALFRTMHTGLQVVADIKLKAVVGPSINAAKPQLAEAPASATSLRNIATNLDAYQSLYFGGGRGGLSMLVATYGDDPDLDPLMRKAFRATIETARSIAAPLDRAVTDPDYRPQVEKLLTQVLALKQIVRTRLAQALDISVGFNALDGD